MDIFEYAKEFNTDYYDPEKSEVYKVQDYNNRKKLGLSDDINSIEVTDLEGNTIRHIFEK